MTQGEIEKLPEGIAEIFMTLENRIMEDVIRRIRINGFSTASADWQITRIQQLSESEEYIRTCIKNTLELSDDALEGVFDDAVYSSYMGHERAYRVMGIPRIPYEENSWLKALVEAVKRQTKDEFENITRSMAIAAKGPGGNVILTPVMSFYRQELDQALMGIQTGAFDYQSSLMRVVKKLKDSGIRSVSYESGRSNRVDVAARRAVLTGFRQVQEKLNEQTAAELGTDYFEVSYHVGARPTHQPWQGRVYSWEDLHTVCGLGTVTGLHGANCYHDYNPFTPGVSVRTYTDEQLDEWIREENTPKEYNGKEYTTYEALQEQRRLERSARAAREEIAMLREGKSNPDEIIYAKARLQGIMQKYSDFSEKMGLPMQHERIYLDGLKGDFRLTAKEKKRLKEQGDTPIKRLISAVESDKIKARKTAALGEELKMPEQRTAEIGRISARIRKGKLPRIDAEEYGVSFIEDMRPEFPPDNIMAGKGCKTGRQIDEIDRLVFDYSIFDADAEGWAKRKARYWVYDEYGEMRQIEIHWYEHPKVGKTEDKVKVDDYGEYFVDMWE